MVTRSCFPERKLAYIGEIVAWWHYGNIDDFQEPLIVASTRDTPEMLQQCPTQHGGVVLSVLRIKEHKRTYRTTEGLCPILTSVVTFYLLLFTISQLYYMIKTST
jgi:hypothetical protein